MKKLFTLAIIAVSLVSGAFASTGTSSKSKAAAHLEANYATAKDAVWTYTENWEKARITAGAELVDVYYDAYGNLIGATKTMAFDKLPKPALETLTTDYTFPTYQLTDCISFTDADGYTSYFVSFDMDGETVMLSISAGGIVSVM